MGYALVGIVSFTIGFAGCYLANRFILKGKLNANPKKETK